MAGLTVQLSPQGNPSDVLSLAQTASDGSYSFTGLAAGSYEIQLPASALSNFALGTPTPGTAGGNAVGSSEIDNATLTVSQMNATDYNFAILGAQANASPAATATPDSTTPTVTSISPVAGPTAGSTSVTITGTDLTGTTAVDFGTVAATSFTVSSDTQIIATSPAGSGTVDVQVTGPAGTSATSVNDQFAYMAVTGISPATGPAAGNTTVTITGTGFNYATNVYFGGTAANDVAIVSPTEITAKSPGGSGTVNVTVAGPGGPTTISSADQFTYMAVNSVSPPEGPTGGGTLVTILGTGFTGATAVDFGTVAATNVHVDSSTEITADSPAGSGTVDVTVTGPGGTTAASPSTDQFTYMAVTSVSPAEGPSTGGTTVTITGTGFTAANGVEFGGVAATSFQFVSSTEITATSPAGSGTVDVTVKDPGGTSNTSLADQFTYIAITGITPKTGPIGGGTSVTITGTGFTDASAVDFGTTAATNFQFVSASEITATSPAGTGTVDITVTTPDGTTPDSSADQFTYTPTVTSVTPSKGSTAGGTTVTIVGSSLGTMSTATVKFGTAVATISSDTGTQIVATSPAGAAGVVDVTVTTTAGGTSATGSVDQFTYVTLPTLTGIAPAAGPLAGGTSVTITGTNFTGATAVDFGTIAATSYTVNSATQITATSPAGTGTVDVTVLISGGASATSSADQFSYMAAPTLTSITPTAGALAGGTSVTITGTGFTGATKVDFGAAAATSFTVNSATQITAASPAGSGTVDVTVTGPGGATTTSSADQFTYTAAPVVTTNPSNQTVAVGGTAAFTVAATSNPSPTVQWEVSSGSGYTPLSDGGVYSGSSTDTLTITGATAAMNGDNYEAIFTNSAAEVNTTAATLTVQSLPTVTTNPTNQTVVVGNTATFTAAASGTPTPTVQWEVSTNGGSSFSAISGATSTTYSLTAAAADDGDQYKAIFTNSLGTATTNEATLETNVGTDSISGFVLLPGGAGFAGLTVQLSPQGNPNNVSDVAQTASDGSYDFTGLAVGTYKIQLPSSELSNLAPGTPTPGAAGGNAVGSAEIDNVPLTASQTSATDYNFAILGVQTSEISLRMYLASTGSLGQYLTSLHDAPSVDANGSSSSPYTATYSTGGSGVAIAPNATINAPSSPTLTSMTVTIQSPPDGSSEQLSATTTGTNLTSNSPSNVLTISGVANVSAYQTVLDELLYSDTASSASLGNRTISITVDDGTDSSTVVTTTVDVVLGAPTVTAISPPAGSLAGGTSLTITGTNFTGATKGDFGTTAATTFQVVSATQITATSPAGSTGTVDVTVTCPDGTSSTSSADQFSYTSAPAVTGISPATGSTSGGTSVTITGTGLLTATKVDFGTTAATNLEILSATQITATSPAGSAGAVDVTVTTPGGTSATAAADQFTYAALPTVTGISPAAGPLAGETSVTITGTGFTGATLVDFGTAAATNLKVVSATQITATSPAGTGTVDVSVTTPGGTSTTGAADDQFTYTAVPAVTGVSPTAGPTTSGTAVTITGTAFTGATLVDFGTVAATNLKVVSATQITATSPAGTGTVDVSVTTPGGTSTTGAADDQFTYTAAPTVTGLNTSAGPTAGGTGVTISGTNLGTVGTATVKFGSVVATPLSDTGTQIVLFAPAGTAGTVDVTVTTAGGTSATGTTDQFTYEGVPAVTGLNVSSGPTNGGTSVTITGTNMADATVAFGGVAAKITSDTATQIVATSPAGEGTADVIVTTPSGVSTAVQADKFTYLAPTVTGVGVDQATGTYGANIDIPILITFSEAVDVSTAGGTPQLTLNNGAVVNYSSGSGTSTLTFSYTVLAGQSTSGQDLDYASTTALALKSGNITDLAGASATVTLPTPGSSADGLATQKIIINS